MKQLDFKHSTSNIQFQKFNFKLSSHTSLYLTFDQIIQLQKFYRILYQSPCNHPLYIFYLCITLSTNSFILSFFLSVLLIFYISLSCKCNYSTLNLPIHLKIARRPKIHCIAKSDGEKIRRAPVYKIQIVIILKKRRTEQNRFYLRK